MATRIGDVSVMTYKRMVSAIGLDDQVRRRQAEYARCIVGDGNTGEVSVPTSFEPELNK
jgi:hypothetical protein